MKFVKVSEIPQKSAPVHRMEAYLKEFMHMHVKIVRVEDHGYKSAKVAANCIGAACKRHVMPIDVRLSDGQVYLIRRDI